jgi:hypothetical protein
MLTLKSKLILGLCLLVSTMTYSAEYFETESINFYNSGPILSLFSFIRPEALSNKEIGTFTYKNQLSLSNYISSTSKDGDQFFIDGESWVLRNTLNYQLSANFLISASLPWLKHSGGISDNFIYNFHDIFQLPQNGRRKENNDDIRWILNSDGVNLLNVEDELSAWGDLSITGQLTSQVTPSLKWAFMTKFPTGDYDKQTGSEKLEFGISVVQSNPDWFKNRTILKDIHLAFWYGSGVSYIGQVNSLKRLDQKPYIVTARSGLAYSPYQDWHLKCQLDIHSPLFNTKIRELGWLPVQISFSTWHRLSQSTNFEFVIIEDLRPRSAPDVIFQTSLQTTF